MPDSTIPDTWMVARLDGRGFHRFTDRHGFVKPNDVRCLDLMNKCAQAVMCEFRDLVIAYGESDEYSFVFKNNTKLFGRRTSKLISSIVSYFSSCFVFSWAEFFPGVILQYPPTFDCRIVCYPTRQTVIDYCSWRQADCHINNLYNTCFWAMVKRGTPNSDAEAFLKVFCVF